jgi:hypothetical protein
VKGHRLQHIRLMAESSFLDPSKVCSGQRHNNAFDSLAEERPEMLHVTGYQMSRTARDGGLQDWPVFLGKLRFESYGGNEFYDLQRFNKLCETLALSGRRQVSPCFLDCVSGRE